VGNGNLRIYHILPPDLNRLLTNRSSLFFVQFLTFAVIINAMALTGIHELVQRARNGNAQAWAELQSLVKPFLLARAQKMLGTGWSERSVSDLLQETCIRAWQHLPKFRGGNDDDETGARLRSWLKKIMRNVKLNHDRADKARRPRQGERMLRIATAESDSTGNGAVDPPANISTPSTNLRREEQRDRIARALSRLSEVARKIVEMHLFKKRSFAEVGRRLHLDESTVRYHFHRSVERLGQHLKDLQ
jgi:RNA polymerase sigma factor (sigma-70 family)